MPRTSTRRFRVRHYECNPQGALRDANYLRYMQEAAFDASTEAGYSPARYVEMERLWLIRETQLELLQPVRFGDTIEVTTWVADWTRVRSRRAYEFRLETGVVAARSSTDWAFLDTCTGRPAPIPPEMMGAFFPDELPPMSRSRPRFPTAPEPPGEVGARCRTVERRDLDPAGHVNNAVYLDYAEECGAQTLESCGWSSSRLAEQGLDLATGDHLISYQQQAVVGDVLQVVAWFSIGDGCQLVRHATIQRAADGAGLARVRSTLVCAEASTGERRSFPEDLWRALAPVTAS